MTFCLRVSLGGGSSLLLYLLPSSVTSSRFDCFHHSRHWNNMISDSLFVFKHFENEQSLFEITRHFLTTQSLRKFFSGECFDLRVLFVTLFWIEFFVTFPLFRLSTLSLSGRLFVQPSPWPEQCTSKSKGNIEIWPQNSLHFETIFLIPRCVHWNRLENYHQPAYIRPWKINLNDSFEFPRIVRLKFQQNSLVAFFFSGGRRTNRMTDMS